jgi:hypothetical protein
MKNLVLVFVLFFSVLSSFASSTDASRFAAKEYSKQTGNAQVYINVKKEHTIENMQKIGEKNVPAITFGYGDMKAKKCRKTRISYICFLDDDYKPFWSYIIPTK